MSSHRLLPFFIGCLLSLPALTAADLKFEPRDELFLANEFLIETSRRASTRKIESYLSREMGTEINIASLGDETLGLVKLGDSEAGWVNLNDHLAMLEKAPGVSKAESNYRVFLHRSPFSDPLQNQQWYLDAIRAPQAWEVIRDAGDVVVAVIDDAIMTGHEDLRGNLWTNPREIPGNGRDDDNNGYVDDINGWNFGGNNNNPGGPCLAAGGHGTHVSGAIGAIGGNNRGVVGMAPRVRIMALAVARPAGCGLDSAGILAAVNYAVANGARVINLSLGGPVSSRIAQRVYQKASDAGALVVIAAGNAGLSNDHEDIPPGSRFTYAVIERNNQIVHRDFSPSYPASYSRSVAGILTVANLASAGAGLKPFVMEHSYTRLGRNARFENQQLVVDGWEQLPPGKMVLGSSYGKRSVHIGTPGTDIYSAVPSMSGSTATSGYAMMTGTSMASPVTAGAAALLWAAFPELSNIQIKERLLSSARVNSQLSGVVSSGAQLDMFAALCGAQFATVAAGCPGQSATQKPPKSQKPKPVQPEPPNTNPPKSKTPEPEEQEPERELDANDWLRGEW